MEELLEDALSRVEIPELRRKDFTRYRMEWIESGNVDCNQPEQAARFELALDQWIASLSLESPRIQPAIAETTKKSNQQSSLNEQPKKVLLSPLLESFESMGGGDTELVLGAVIYQIGLVSATTLDGFCIVIGLKNGGWKSYWKTH